MRKLNWRMVDKRFYLIDTFTGPVAAQYSAQEVQSGRPQLAEQNVAAGACVTDVDRVRANFIEWPNALVVQGVIPDVLAGLNVEKVAFLHIDLNCAFPERAALEYFWDRLSPSAFVLLDDYAFVGHNCQMRAIDAVAASRGCDVLSLPTGQGLLVKPA